MPRKTLRLQLKQTHDALIASQDVLSHVTRQLELARMQLAELQQERTFLRELLMRLTSEDLRFFHPHSPRTI